MAGPLPFELRNKGRKAISAYSLVCSGSQYIVLCLNLFLFPFGLTSYFLRWRCTNLSSNSRPNHLVLVHSILRGIWSVLLQNSMEHRSQRMTHIEQAKGHTGSWRACSYILGDHSKPRDRSKRWGFSAQIRLLELSIQTSDSADTFSQEQHSFVLPVLLQLKICSEPMLWGAGILWNPVQLGHISQDGAARKQCCSSKKLYELAGDVLYRAASWSYNSRFLSGQIPDYNSFLHSLSACKHTNYRTHDL